MSKRDVIQVSNLSGMVVDTIKGQCYNNATGNPCNKDYEARV